MKKHSSPFVPQERKETVRQAIAALLRQGPVSAREISAAVGISEKQVGDHLEHVRRSAGHEGEVLVQEAARCLDCGFVFSKRDRLRTPGKCPVCRSEGVSEPRFALEQRN
ncbi:MAG: transcriptional regulator [Syntrophotaleaceae bacterium]